MGLFNNYSKPGPGIPADAPEKKGVFLFLEILGRKFFKLIEVNLVYFILSIPFFIITLIGLAPQYISIILPNIILEEDYNLYILVNLLVTGIMFNFYGAGPMSAVYAFVTRSFVRSEPIFVFSDGFDKFKENFKQSIIITIIDIIVIFSISIGLRLYLNNQNIIFLWLFYLTLAISIIYMFAHIFIYQIIGTYECSVVDAIKSALIMVLAKLPMCTLLVFITGVICVLMFAYLGLIAIPIYATIGMSFTRFPLEFYATRVIKKNIEQDRMK